MRHIVSVLVSTYANGFRLLRELWGTVVISLLVNVGAVAIGVLLTHYLSTRLGKTLVETLAAVAGLWLSAPYAVAQYRYLLLGESFRWPHPLRRTPNVDHFFAWTAIMRFAWAAPTIIYFLTRPHWDGPLYYVGPNPPDTHGNSSLFATLTVLVLWYLAVRLATLLPAIAAGRPQTLLSAWAQTRGRFWFIALSFILVMMPIGCAFLALVYTRAQIPGLGEWSLPVLLAGIAAATNVLLVAACAQLYERIETQRFSSELHPMG